MQVEANGAVKAAAPPMAISAAAKSALSLLEERVRREVDALLAGIAEDDMNGISQVRMKAFEPMEKEQRCIVYVYVLYSSCDG